MKTQYVRELAEGTAVDSQFALFSKEMRSTRSREAYLALELGDRTGRIPAVCFRPSSEAIALPSGGVIRVCGVVTTYRGTKRVSAERIEPASSYDPQDFIESSTRDPEEMVAEFKALAATVRDRDLRRILKGVFGEREFFEQFARCPGARVGHHARLCGLLEHSIAVATVCRTVSGVYQGVDTDLLVTAALLHDVGRVDELTYQTAVDRTDEGRLLGHAVLSERRVRDAAVRVRPGASARLVTQLSHAVLSHHGGDCAGAHPRPSTFEALLLSHADALDVGADGFLSSTDAASRAQERWTRADNMFHRPLRVPAGRCETEAPWPAADALCALRA
ncbi:MAG TPA: HD domain-containing protein [Coriobacteriia bacterium]|nr:HD domain-containing protein [Coriobacteriia bacterium]